MLHRSREPGRRLWQGLVENCIAQGGREMTITSKVKIHMLLCLNRSTHFTMLYTHEVCCQAHREMDDFLSPCPFFFRCDPFSSFALMLDFNSFCSLCILIVGITHFPSILHMPMSFINYLAFLDMGHVVEKLYPICL
jgi:hypothetical protein